MLKDVAPEPSIKKQEFEDLLPGLREDLIQAQLKLGKSKASVVVIICGMDAAGKGEVIHRFNEWLDPRGVNTHAFWQPSDEIAERPRYWRYWRAFPSRGKTAIFFGAWYSDLIFQKAYGDVKTNEEEAEIRHIRRLETMQALDRKIFVKFWFHLSKKAQHERLKALYENPKHHWRVVNSDWKHHKMHGAIVKSAESILEATHIAEAPWHIIDSSDHNARDLKAGKILLEAMRQCESQSLGGRIPSPAARSAKRGEAEEVPNQLAQIEFPDAPKEKRSRKALLEYQSRFNKLVWTANHRKVSTVAVFEGWDASGKGGCIRRVTQAMDARLYRIIPIAAPTQLELSHHYLWRFWSHIPRDGYVAIFDRSWYGRVLVERVEGFAKPEEWRRAYEEINDFEREMAEHGILVLKFWLHVTKEEQLERFKKREEIAYKRYKITQEDWRNREKWDQYEAAVNEMAHRTSTTWAPWTIIPANSKKYARVQVVKTLCENLQARLDAG